MLRGLLKRNARFAYASIAILTVFLSGGSVSEPEPPQYVAQGEGGLLEIPGPVFAPRQAVPNRASLFSPGSSSLAQALQAAATRPSGGYSPTESEVAAEAAPGEPPGQGESPQRPGVKIPRLGEEAGSQKADSEEGLARLSSGLQRRMRERATALLSSGHLGKGDWDGLSKDLVAGLQNDVVNSVLAAGAADIRRQLPFLRSLEIRYQSAYGGRDDLLEFGAMLSLLERERSVLFLQAEALLQDFRGEGANVGLGYRFIPYQNLQLGVNLFYDWERDLSLRRASAGLEIRSQLVDLHANLYDALESEAQSANGEERIYGLDGWDTGLALRAPWIPWLEASARYYKWNRLFGEKDLKGQEYGLHLHPIPLLKLSVSYDDAENAPRNWGTQLALRYEFGSNWAEQTRWRTEVTDLDLQGRRYDRVRRQYQIRTQRVARLLTIQAGGRIDLTDRAFANPPWRIRGAGTVGLQAQTNDNPGDSVVISGGSRFEVSLAEGARSLVLSAEPATFSTGDSSGVIGQQRGLSTRSLGQGVTTAQTDAPATITVTSRTPYLDGEAGAYGEAVRLTVTSIELGSAVLCPESLPDTAITTLPANSVTPTNIAETGRNVGDILRIGCETNYGASGARTYSCEEQDQSDVGMWVQQTNAQGTEDLSCARVRCGATIPGTQPSNSVVPQIEDAQRNAGGDPVVLGCDANSSQGSGTATTYSCTVNDAGNGEWVASQTGGGISCGAIMCSATIPGTQPLNSVVPQIEDAQRNAGGDPVVLGCDANSSQGSGTATTYSCTVNDAGNGEWVASQTGGGISCGAIMCSATIPGTQPLNSVVPQIEDAQRNAGGDPVVLGCDANFSQGSGTATTYSCTVNDAGNGEWVASQTGGGISCTPVRCGATIPGTQPSNSVVPQIEDAQRNAGGDPVELGCDANFSQGSGTATTYSCTVNDAGNGEWVASQTGGGISCTPVRCGATIPGTQPSNSVVPQIEDAQRNAGGDPVVLGCDANSSQGSGTATTYSCTVNDAGNGEWVASQTGGGISCGAIMCSATIPGTPPLNSVVPQIEDAQRNAGGDPVELGCDTNFSQGSGTATTYSCTVNDAGNGEWVASQTGGGISCGAIMCSATIPGTQPLNSVVPQIEDAQRNAGGDPVELGCDANSSQGSGTATTYSCTVNDAGNGEWVASQTGGGISCGAIMCSATIPGTPPLNSVVPQIEDAQRNAGGDPVVLGCDTNFSQGSGTATTYSCTVNDAGNGEWVASQTGGGISCGAIMCSATIPGTPPLNSVVPQIEDAQRNAGGDPVVLGCDTNFSQGSGTATTYSCTVNDAGNGEWVASQTGGGISCGAIMCSATIPGTPPLNSVVPQIEDAQRNAGGDPVELGCDTNFSQGSGTATTYSCTVNDAGNGEWVASQTGGGISCAPVRCGATIPGTPPLNSVVPQIEDAQRNAGGDPVELGCDANFSQGSGTATTYSCTVNDAGNGEWVASQTGGGISCTPVRCGATIPGTQPSNSVVPQIEDAQRNAGGDPVELGCATNYEGSGTTTYSCTANDAGDGVWVKGSPGDLSCARIMCAAALPNSETLPSNSVRPTNLADNDRVAGGDPLEIGCASTYIKSGERNYSCENQNGAGVWVRQNNSGNEADLSCNTCAGDLPDYSAQGYQLGMRGSLNSADDGFRDATYECQADRGKNQNPYLTDKRTNFRCNDQGIWEALNEEAPPRVVSLAPCRPIPAETECRTLADNRLADSLHPNSPGTLVFDQTGDGLRDTQGDLGKTLYYECQTGTVLEEQRSSSSIEFDPASEGEDFITLRCFRMVNAATGELEQELQLVGNIPSGNRRCCRTLAGHALSCDTCSAYTVEEGQSAPADAAYSGSPVAERYVENTTVVVDACASGYTKGGESTTYTCQEDGYWTQSGTGSGGALTCSQ